MKDNLPTDLMKESAASNLKHKDISQMMAMKTKSKRHLEKLIKNKYLKARITLSKIQDYTEC